VPAPSTTNTTWVGTGLPWTRFSTLDGGGRSIHAGGNFDGRLVVDSWTICRSPSLRFTVLPSSLGPTVTVVGGGWRWSPGRWCASGCLAGRSRRPRPGRGPPGAAATGCRSGPVGQVLAARAEGLAWVSPSSCGRVRTLLLGCCRRAVSAPLVALACCATLPSTGHLVGWEPHRRLAPRHVECIIRGLASCLVSVRPRRCQKRRSRAGTEAQSPTGPFSCVGAAASSTKVLGAGTARWRLSASGVRRW
jgi:hypothetical protein